MTQIIALISVVGLGFLITKFIIDLVRGKFRC